MSELESSGLLDKEPEQGAPSKPPTPGPAPSTSSTPLDMHSPDVSTGLLPAGQETAETSLAATIVSAVTDEQGGVPKQGQGFDAPEQQTAGASGAAAASNEAAEQRVLGELEGAPTWHEVLMLPILLHACTRKETKRKGQTREDKNRQENKRAECLAITAYTARAVVKLPCSHACQCRC